MKLGNHFPDEFREQFGERHLKPGAVFKLHIKTTTPPKPKRIVILAINEELALVGYLFINSEMNLNVFHNRYLQSLQLPLTADECEYLEWDSFLDCSHIYEKNVEELKDIFHANIGAYLGEISEADMRKICQLIESAKTIPPKIKKRYGFPHKKSS